MLIVPIWLSVACTSRTKYNGMIGRLNASAEK